MNSKDYLENPFLSLSKGKTWRETCKRFVGVFDIVGFKALLEHKGHEKMLEKLRRIHTLKVENSGMNTLGNVRENKNLQAPKFCVFSDTIVLISARDTLEDAKLMIFAAYRLIMNAYVFGLPIKGALSYGKLTFNEDLPILLGKPFIDAYLLQEELQVLSAVLDKTIEKKFRYYEQLDYFGEFVKYPVPFKKRTEDCYILDWCSKYDQDAEDRLIFDNFEKDCMLTGKLMDNTKTFWCKMYRQNEGNC